MPWEERVWLHGKLTVAQTYVRYLLDRVTPQPASVAEFLGEVERRFGSAGGWLQTQAWTGQDQTALHRALVGPR
jgi:hypothetical protein